MSALEAPYEEWVAKVESDLLNIENNIAAARVPWDTVCFHAQQAAEKYAIGVRYPLQLAALGEPEGREAIEAARRIRAGIVPLLGGAS